MQLLKASTVKTRLVEPVCELLHTLMITDLELLDGQHRCQEKFATLQLSEYLVQWITAQVKNPSSAAAAASSVALVSWPLKVLGTFGRWNEENKERLFHIEVYQIFPHITGEALKEFPFLAECLSWCVANVSYPDGNMQDVLGTMGVVATVVTILDVQRDHKVVIYEACRALRNLCCNHDGNLDRAIDANGMEIFQILVLLYEDDGDVLQWIMFALATLVSSSAAMDRVNALSLPSKVVSIMRKYVKHADLMQWTALVLSTLARQTEMADQLAAMNTCEALVTVRDVFTVDLLCRLLIICVALCRSVSFCRRWGCTWTTPTFWKNSCTPLATWPYGPSLVAATS